MSQLIICCFPLYHCNSLLNTLPTSSLSFHIPREALVILLHSFQGPPYACRINNVVFHNLAQPTFPVLPPSTCFLPLRGTHHSPGTVTDIHLPLSRPSNVIFRTLGPSPIPRIFRRKDAQRAQEGGALLRDRGTQICLTVSLWGATLNKLHSQPFLLPRIRQANFHRNREKFTGQMS